MNIVWFEREELTPAVVKQLKGADVVLDIGCGIMPQPYITPKVHICCEPFEQYIEVLRERVTGETDRTYVALRATWAEAINIFPPESVDTVFLVDVVEHLAKEDGIKLLKATQRIVKQQIVLFTPLGFILQAQVGEKDAWNLDGGDWQEHKSGWAPKDFNDNWKILACKDFHITDNIGKLLEKPCGAFWAIWEAPVDSKGEGQRFQKAPKSLWLNFQALQQEHQALQQEHQALQQEHQALQQEHQALQQSRTVIFARKLAEHPLLMKLAKMTYEFLVKIYRLFMIR